MRLPPASPRAPRWDDTWRGLALFASGLVSACSLDSTGVESAASTASASSGDVASTASGTPASSSSAGADPTGGGGGGGGGDGDGGDATSAGGSPANGGGGTGGTAGGGAGGEGGAGGAGGSGGQGAGGGGTGGTGGSGGEGGGGPLDEWVLRVFGGDTQQVNDIALSEDGVHAYVIGTMRQQPTTFESSPDVYDADGDDIFVAKVTRDGSSVAWFVGFGGPNDDKGMAVAARGEGAEERVFIAGTAKGQSDDDYFAPGLDPSPTGDWGFLVEIDPTDGSALGGEPWGPVNADQPVDVDMTATRAIAVGTVGNGYLDSLGMTSQGTDVILAGVDLATSVYATRVISRAGDQRGVAIAASPNADGFALTGEFGGPSWSAHLSLPVDASCDLATGGADDVFVAFYAFNIDYICLEARNLGSTANDRAIGVGYDGDAAYVALRTDAGAFGDAASSFVVKTSPTVALFWDQPITDNGGGNGISEVAVQGTRIAAGGRRQERGFVVSLDPATGDPAAARQLVDDTSPVQALAIDGSQWLVGGRYTGSPNFGGMIGEVMGANGTDGWLARMAPPR